MVLVLASAQSLWMDGYFSDINPNSQRPLPYPFGRMVLGGEWHVSFRYPGPTRRIHLEDAPGNVKPQATRVHPRK